MRVLGIDGCRAGWVAVRLRGGAFDGAFLASTLDRVIRAAGDVRLIGIDMPLGLLDRGWREADLAAAAFIGPRRSSVFRVPPHGVLVEADFVTANARCRELTGGGLSRQTWGLRDKLHEANAYWHENEGMLFEVHPEVSFRAMSGAPLTYRKSTWNGHGLRRDLLARNGVELPAALGLAGAAGPDDVLDAAAVAWSAQRIAGGAGGSLPDPPQSDAYGRPIAIWY